MRKLLLIRPQPGLSASAERARALGLDVIRCPLFRIEPVEWAAPEPGAYDGLLLTSANAVRTGGVQLERLKSLPVYAVGSATAAAAREAGFRIEQVGGAGADELIATVPSLRLLHLGGEDVAVSNEPIDRRVVYRAMPIESPALPRLEGLVVAVHSPRAGARLAELADSRHRTAIAAISAAAAAACGSGWESVAVADSVGDADLLALAASLCQTSDE